MAKNFIQGRGTVIAVAAPTGGVVAGELVVIRSLYGVALHDAAQGARVEIECPGGPVFSINGDTNLQINVGDRVFWDSTNEWVDKTTASQICVGVAVPLDNLSDVAKGTSGAKVRVLLGAQTPAEA